MCGIPLTCLTVYLAAQLLICASNHPYVVSPSKLLTAQQCITATHLFLHTQTCKPVNLPGIQIVFVVHHQLQMRIYEVVFCAFFMMAKDKCWRCKPPTQDGTPKYFGGGGAHRITRRASEFRSNLSNV